MSSPAANVERGQGSLQTAEMRAEVVGGEPQRAEHHISAWRMPSQPGKLPCYVRAHFRMKVFALIAIQSMAVFGVAALVDFALTTPRERAALPWAVCIALGILAVIALVVLHLLKHAYPMNYVMLVLFTLMVGASWGISGNVLLTHVHFQLLGIVCVAMFVATSAQAFALQSSSDGLRAVAGPILLGWAVGSLAVFVVGVRLGSGRTSILVAEGLSIVQIAWLLLDMNGPLQTCNPDDFMKVVISMDSTLLVIVSIPLWITVTCCVHADTHPGRDEAAQVDREAAQEDVA